jgi:hypothetical protein
MMPADSSEPDWQVISRKVPARHLRTEANDVNEWGYFPEKDSRDHIRLFDFPMKEQV